MNIQGTEATYQSHHSYDDVPTFEESQELGQDAFLQLLIAQLNNQDPLNPMEDRDFIAQMAQFSSLEQMMSINDTLEEWMNSPAEQHFAQQAHLIGHTVQWEGEDTHGEGKVVSVVKKENDVYVEVQDGTRVNIADIHQVLKAVD